MHSLFFFDMRTQKGDDKSCRSPGSGERPRIADRHDNHGLVHPLLGPDPGQNSLGAKATDCFVRGNISLRNKQISKAVCD